MRNMSTEKNIEAGGSVFWGALQGHRRGFCQYEESVVRIAGGHTTARRIRGDMPESADIRRGPICEKTTMKGSLSGENLEGHQCGQGARGVVETLP
jgi:hypothetical protein